MIPPSRRIVVLRASRDTLVLVASTLCVTFALAYAVRQHPGPVATQPEQQVWAGQLAEVAPETVAPARPETLTSASLTVPKAALALPPLPTAAPPAAKTPACATQPCPVKTAAPMPPARQKLAMVDGETAKAVPATTSERKAAKETKAGDRRFGLSDINPLPHLPDSVRKPFSYAGAKISGWMDWF